MAAHDISAELADSIADAQGGGGKPFLRHGAYYKLLITRVHSKKVKLEAGVHRFAFMEFKVLESRPHPAGAILTSLQSKDDGTNPNAKGSECSYSIDFDGNGAAMAPQNVKDFICGLFGVMSDELSKEETKKTWRDLCRRSDVPKGGVDYVNPETGAPVLAEEAKIANAACGMVIEMSTSAKELKRTRTIKDLAAEKREYFTMKHWKCAGKPGQPGENSMENIAKRRAEIMNSMADDDDEDVEDSLANAGDSTSHAPPTPPAAPAPPAAAAPPAPPAPPAAAAPPPPAVDPNWPPVAPWKLHTTAPGYVWSDPTLGGTNAVISEADYRAGKRG